MKGSLLSRSNSQIVTLQTQKRATIYPTQSCSLNKRDVYKNLQLKTVNEFMALMDVFLPSAFLPIYRGLTSDNWS